MSNLSNLLEPSAVLAPLNIDGRRKVLRALSDALSVPTGLASRDILEAITERERLGSTAVGDGVAIPHARLSGIDRPIGAFALVKPACDFEAVDERPCDIVFMLLAPERDGGDHLRALAQVARTFRDAELRAALRERPEKAVSLLMGEMQGAAA